MGATARQRCAAAMFAVAMLTAACSSSGEPEGDGTTSANGSPTVPEAVPTDDLPRIRPTVEPPGSVATPAYGDDLLVVDDETLPSDLIEQIEAIKVKGRPAVARTEQFSLGQASVENRLLNVAAVDPAGYRLFSDIDREWQDPWDRIAGGEIAVFQRLQERLPLDEDDYLAVGSGTDFNAIHVAAWLRYQVGTIDALVNKAWGKELGLPENNALLINTGGIAPSDVRKAIEKIDDTLSITALDIVAETGIDPNTFQTIVPVGTYADAVGVYRYTPIGGGAIRPDPGWVEEYIITDTVPIIGTVTCNKYMMPQLKAALGEIVTMGLGDQLHYHAGCFVPRFIAGSNTLSNHSFGLAIDLDSRENGRGTVGTMHPTVVAIFKRWGFDWGGDWKWTDPMHFELREIVSPG